MCDCVHKANKVLAEHNTKIDMVDTISMTTGKFEPRMAVPTTRIDTKKRGTPMKVFAGFCPLCGAKLETAK
jgi:hypothetical protein